MTALRTEAMRIARVSYGDWCALPEAEQGKYLALAHRGLESDRALVESTILPTPPEPKDAPRLPTDATERKAIPLFSGCLAYFPDALAAVASLSKAGNDQHNPGEPIGWARAKSTDQADTIARHLLEHGSIDTDGHRHSAKLAWRALALLQLEIEADTGLPPSRGSR